MIRMVLENMGAKITTEIDPHIKAVFEAMREQLGVTYKEILEEGILARIRGIDPIKATEIQIAEAEFQLSAQKQYLASLRVSIEKIEARNEQKNRDQEIEKERCEWFRKKAAAIASMLDRGNIDWSIYTNSGLFDSAKEVRNWCLIHLEEWRQSREA